MKALMFVALALAFASTTNAGVKISRWEAGQDRRTQAPEISFTVTKTRLAGFNIHTFGFTETVWTYFITLRGDRSTYDKDQIVLSSFDLSQIGSPKPAVDSGTIRVDRPNRKIVIALRINHAGKIDEFVANGEYEIPRDAK